MNARAIAARVITEILENPSAHSFTQVLSQYKKLTQERDKAFVQALTFGVFRFYFRLQFFAKKLIHKPLKAKDRDIYHLILLGLFQLIYLQTPPHAAIKETVEAAVELNKLWAKGFINAVLREYLRQADSLEKAAEANEEAKTAHPKWLLNKIKKAWPNDWMSIIEANNQNPPFILRVNARKMSREDYLSVLDSGATSLSATPLSATPLLYSPVGIKMDKPVDVKALPLFDEGALSVQDGAGQLAASLLEPFPDCRVLDACAAPGGKLCHLLEYEPAIKEAVAIDVSTEKTNKIKDNLKRLGLQATVLTGDASTPSEWWDGILFDRILCDAPCSATGVIRRHPDIKLSRKPEDIPRLAKTELELLNALWPLLKENGLLLYATCSLLPEENEEVIEKFLNLHENARSVPIHLPVGLPQTRGHQILPGQNEMDGFYYARIRKM